MPPNIPDHLISQLSEFINSQIGLYFPKNRWTDLRRSMAEVARDLAEIHEMDEDPVSCVRWLLSKPLDKKELDTLAKHLTIGETYFFRDKHLFQALRKHILPNLIESRRKNGKSLRFWSAGCCTGEEPYSLAILIDQMIPAWQEWNLRILATDINTRFLTKAEKGIYGNWSFRNVPEQIIKKYFKKTDGKNFEIFPSVKKMVTFFQLNLVANGYPPEINDAQGMDIIFCRNVLMYFEPDVRTQIIGRFSRALSENAWLVFSPSESPCIRHPDLSPVQFPGVTLYRKTPFKAASSNTISIRDTGIAAIRKKPSVLPQSPIPSQRFADRNMRSSLAPTPVTRDLKRAIPKKRAESNWDLYQKAFILANLGKLDEAETYCKQAIDDEKLHPEYHYLLATIYQEKGRIKESERSFKHTLYLDPNFVLAHFSLGNLTRQDGRRNESEKYFRNTLSLLRSMNPQETLPHSQGMTAGRLLDVVKSMMR